MSSADLFCLPLGSTSRAAGRRKLGKVGREKMRICGGCRRRSDSTLLPSHLANVITVTLSVKYDSLKEPHKTKVRLEECLSGEAPEATSQQGQRVGHGHPAQDPPPRAAASPHRGAHSPDFSRPHVHGFLTRHSALVLGVLLTWCVLRISRTLRFPICIHF